MTFVPPIIEICTVHGLCNASCVMCPVNDMPEKVLMSTNRFSQLLRKFEPYKNQLDLISFVGMGEPLLDKEVEQKIKMAKEFGFKRARIVTNASALTLFRARALLDAGLDLLIVSIDSDNRNSYEKIRVNLKFDKVVSNVKSFIEMRDLGNYNAAIHVRFCVMESNFDQVDSFSNFWIPFIDLNKGDLVLTFPEHNWPRANDASQPVFPKTSECSYVFDRLIIQANGSIQLCCVDNNADFFEFGNAFNVDPIEVFNGPTFVKIRELMQSGDIDKILPCKYCNVPIKREIRAIV